MIDGRVDEAERLAAASRALFEGIDDPDSSRFYTAVMFIARVEQERADEVAELVAPSPAHTLWRAARCDLDASAGRCEAAATELAAPMANDCATVPRSDEWLPALRSAR